MKGDEPAFRSGGEVLFRCPSAELGEGRMRFFSWKEGSRDAHGLVLRHRGVLYAFRNECAHWRVRLNDQAGQVYDHDAGHLVCSVHGARFALGQTGEREQGECISGPCVGAALQSLRVHEESAGDVVVRRRGLLFGAGTLARQGGQGRGET